MEGADEVSLPARVALDEVAWVVAIVGDIAAATAGDADFGEDFGAFFEDEDFFESSLGGGDGSEESGGSSADDDEIEFFGDHVEGT